MDNQWKLLEPVKIGKRVLRNRIVMAPMETRMNTPDGDVTQAMIDYYAERAKGGAAAIIVENTFIDNESSRSSLVSSGLYCDHLIAGKNLLAESIQENGALAIIQLNHGGRQINCAANQNPCVAPSSIACKVMQQPPKELSIEEIEKIEDSFADAARRAEMAGFDGVEIHAAHGYLVSTFLSPYSNFREDQYGGDPKKRALFLKNIIRKVRQNTGKKFIVGVRVSGSEFLDCGQTIDLAAEQVALVEQDIDYVHVSAGNYETAPECMITPMYEAPGKLVTLAAEMKKRVKIPVITVGALDAALAEDAIVKGDADLAAFGRALIADPELPNKLLAGRLEDIRPCCRGNEGCLSRFSLGIAMRCEFNPACGREREYKITRTNFPKKILVVGGGPAGQEAARVADLMGHEVTLVEKTDHLGGHLVEGSVPDFKKKTGELLVWLDTQLKKSNVKVLFNSPGTPELVKQIDPDALILAVGSKYQCPRILGHEKALKPDKALLDPESTGNRVVVVGGGLIGSETALALAKLGKEVMIVEMMDEIVPEHESFSKDSIKRSLAKNSVQIYTRCTVNQITDDGVVCTERSGDTMTLQAESVILATGLTANISDVEALNGLVKQTFIIGDCMGARKVYNSFHEAWQAVRRIK